jgi:hypothetical protein
MALVYTITDLPPVWPGKRTAYPKVAPFKSLWSRTEKALERELGYRHLGARRRSSSPLTCRAVRWICAATAC